MEPKLLKECEIWIRKVKRWGAEGWMRGREVGSLALHRNWKCKSVKESTCLALAKCCRVKE